MLACLQRKQCGSLTKGINNNKGRRDAQQSSQIHQGLIATPKPQRI